MSVSTEAKATPSDDIEALTRLVSLPQRPQHAQWSRDTLGSPGMGPTDWSLTALLQYAPKDAEALAKNLKAVSGPPPSVMASWLPAEAREKLDGTVKAYDASRFYRSPLQNGALFDVGGNRFVLYLHTM